jgi:hypothetical protein
VCDAFARPPNKALKLTRSAHNSMARPSQLSAVFDGSEAA